MRARRGFAGAVDMARMESEGLLGHSQLAMTVLHLVDAVSALDDIFEKFFSAPAAVEVVESQILPDQADLVGRMVDQFNGCDCRNCRQNGIEEITRALTEAGLELAEKPHDVKVPAAEPVEKQALVLAGRNFGKTKQAADLVARAAKDPHARIAIVAQHPSMAIRMAHMVMRRSLGATFHVNYQEIRWTNGAVALLYTNADGIRGNVHTLAWAHMARQDALQALNLTLHTRGAIVVRTEQEDQLES